MLFNYYRVITRELFRIVVLFILLTGEQVYAQDGAIVVDIDWMQKHLHDEAVVTVDARSEKQYSQGHIPSAVNIPSEANFYMFDGVKMLKSTTELKNIYSSIASDKKVYTYCNKGTDSSLSYALLRRPGYDVAHYDGSWFEWDNDATLPVEQLQMPQQIQ